MARIVLTDKGCRAVKAAPGHRLTLWDHLAPGLGLRVTDAGIRSWIVYRRLGRGGPMRRLTLGRYPDLGIARARALSAPIIEDLAAGVDPAARAAKAEAARKAAQAEEVRRKAGTVAALWTKYVELELRGRLRTAHKIEVMYAADIEPRWATRELTSIRRSDVTALTDAIRGRGSPIQAQRVLETVKAFFRWAQQRDEAFQNPIAPGFRVAKTLARERVLSDAEIAALWAVTEPVAPTPGSRRLLTRAGTPLAAGALVRILLLTGQRLSDWAKAVDGEIVGDELRIPARRYKTGRPQAVPILSEVRVLLATVPRVEGNPFLFARFGTTQFQNLGAAKAKIDAAMRAVLPGGELLEWRIHDLRRTNRTLLARCGVAREIAEQVLGHALPTIEATYNRFLYEAEKRAALSAVTALIMRVVRGEVAGIEINERRAAP